MLNLVLAALQNIHKHPGTTLAGAGLAALHAANSAVNWKQLLITIGIAALGAAAKDPTAK